MIINFQGEQEVTDIISVFLDNKRIVAPVRADQEEGWVEIIVPKLLPQVTNTKNQALADSQKQDPDDDVAEPEWEVKRLTGKVSYLRKKS